MDMSVKWSIIKALTCFLLVCSSTGYAQEANTITIEPRRVFRDTVIITKHDTVWLEKEKVKIDSAIARYFGMSERFIGLTIVAFGTSLPELVTSVTAAKRGNAGIAIGNIVGSNIFNILFVIGTTSLICSVPFESKFMIDSMIAVIAGLVLWFGTMKHQELRKPCGIVMLLCYGLYFMYLCLM